jgi:hypothetical protein
MQQLNKNVGFVKKKKKFSPVQLSGELFAIWHYRGRLVRQVQYLVSH